jgi:hypothetical protein
MKFPVFNLDIPKKTPTGTSREGDSQQKSLSRPKKKMIVQPPPILGGQTAKRSAI